MAKATGDTGICLHGSVVDDDGRVSPGQWVRVSQGRILSVSDEKPVGVVKADYTLADDELLFPAFLDLHTHSSYNMLPLWASPVWAWDNRFQWRANADYKRAIGATNHAIAAAWGHGTKIYRAYNAYSELMALAGGTTVLQENAHLDASGRPQQEHVLIRSTGNPADMGLPPDRDIASVTDWFEPDPWRAPGMAPQDTSGWGVKPVAKGQFDGASYLADFAASVTGTRTHATIVHVAEGRSGWWQTQRGVDAYSRREWQSFMDFVTRRYPGDEGERAVREARLIAIHGCGMDTAGGARSAGRLGTVDFLRRYGVGLIWSPVSNLLLYQDTTPVLPLLDAGLPLMLGTDWTPSGSKTVWEEAKFAAGLLEARGWKGDASLACLRAITSAPADALGLPAGRVKAGNMADFVIIRRPAGVKRNDALGTFRRAGDDEVQAVFVGGVPLYGRPALLRAFGREALPLPGELPARGDAARAYALPDDAGISAADMASAVEAASHVLGKQRAHLLARDDAPYLERMDELRRWVQRFDPKTSPTPKAAPPKPSGLAPGEQEWIYNPGLNPAERIAPDTAALLARMAPCRDTRCEVPRRHPYYHAEVLAGAGDSYGMRVPCMPVVPVLTNRGGLFVVGDYPTAKFAARSSGNLPVISDNGSSVQRANAKLRELLAQASAQPVQADGGLVQTYVEELADIVRQSWGRPPAPGQHEAPQGAHNQFFVPVADVFAPMQDASYFDGYKVRNVAAGVFLQEEYLKAVDVDIDSQVWLTNLIKCFLFHPSMASSYQALGWTDVAVQPSYDALLDVGKVCQQWAQQEVVLAAPKLVLTVGKPPCTLLHGVPIADGAAQGRVYSSLLGQHLKAGDARAEQRLAERLKLSTTEHPPAGKDGKRPPPVTKPLSIVRAKPWADYNVFHMLHPQAVMMAQTAVTTTLQAAAAAQLGRRAEGLDGAALLAAARDAVKRRGLDALLLALPPGQRNSLRTNAHLLETHAVTLANLADTLAAVGLKTGAKAAEVLKAQAEALVAMALAPDVKAMTLQLQALRKQVNTRWAELTR